MPKPLYTEIDFPEIVRQAIDLANQLKFPLMPEGRTIGSKGPPSACIPSFGRLLRVLSAGKPGGLIGEAGSGAGVGTAWLASGLVSGARLISVELNPFLANAVSELFRDYPDVDVRHGDWREVMLADAPFDLLFLDAGIKTDLVQLNWDFIVDLVKIGGQILFDDLTPVDLWPPSWEHITDQKREFAFANNRVLGTEVRTTTTTAALILTRIL